MIDRTQYTTVHEGDVALIRDAFERGQELTKDLALSLFDITDRRFRLAVNALRHRGYPVISESAQGSTYRRARDLDDLRAFIAREIRPRAVDLLEQEHQLKEHAGEHFGVGQDRLILIA